LKEGVLPGAANKRYVFSYALSAKASP